MVTTGTGFSFRLKLRGNKKNLIYSKILISSSKALREMKPRKILHLRLEQHSRRLDRKQGPARARRQKKMHKLRIKKPSVNLLEQVAR